MGWLMGRLRLIVISLFFFPFFVFAAEENLDELDDVRVSRKSSSTFYSGEASGNNYKWQPQIVVYTDTTSSHEVWVFTSTDDGDAHHHAEHR